MRLVMKSALGLVFGLLVLFAVSGGDEARAQCCAPPPPCCTPPAPPPCCTPPSPPPTPTPPCCTPPGHNINVPGVNVNVNASVIVNANVNAQVNASAGASAGSRAGTTVFYGGSGFGGGVMPGQVSVINGLNVEGGREKRRVAYQDHREKTVRVAIEATCLDTKAVPHPASQLFPERDVEADYEGELYRCLAGTRMQYVVAEYVDKINFDGGKTVTCDKDQALFHTREGVVECRKQIPARDCNERSLLRRFGAGIKVLTMKTVETFTAYREEEVESSSSSSSSMTLNGGVGGIAY